MKKVHLVVIVGLLFLFAGIFTANALIKDNAAPADPGHDGTHLCTDGDDEACGTDHKCCNGHCLKVDTCP